MLNSVYAKAIATFFVTLSGGIASLQAQSAVSHVEPTVLAYCLAILLAIGAAAGAYYPANKLTEDQIRKGAEAHGFTLDGGVVSDLGKAVGSAVSSAVSSQVAGIVQNQIDAVTRLNPAAGRVVSDVVETGRGVVEDLIRSHR